MNIIPKSLWKVLKAQPQLKCNYLGWSQPEPLLWALDPSRDDCECQVGKGTLSNSSYKVMMVYATVLQTKPAHCFKCDQPWTPGRPLVNVA